MLPDRNRQQCLSYLGAIMGSMRVNSAWFSLCACFLFSCGAAMETTAPTETYSRQDLHSYSNPDEIVVNHVSLDLSVDFENKALRGFVTLAVERKSGGTAPLILDTRDLKVGRVETSSDGNTFAETAFELGEADKILGSPLRITLPEGATHVRVHYSTAPAASGLQWLEPAQTAGKKLPFLYSQSEPIHARSWIPLQDSPGVRVTYDATIHTPKNLVAVMSAEMAAADATERSGEYKFNMPQAIPSYLIALAVGDLALEAINSRTGVWSEPSVVGRAAKEFEDTEKMMQAVETLYGPYRWGRYDLLVLPPSFPFGGMENPRLTFATPTVLAGDKSLVNLVAHELAHSWSGNLVTNATWRDFWLNEGFTVYLETRIQELAFGERRAAMEAALEVGELKEEMKGLEPRDQVLYIDLAGRDPDAGFTQIPYIKGMLFLRTIEQAVGREKFDLFLRGYFEHFAFLSITTGDFLRYLDEHLLSVEPGLAGKLRIHEWIQEPGLPDNAALPVSDALQQVEAQAKAWLAGQTALEKIPTAGWSTQEWLHFLRSLPEQLSMDQMRRLDETFRFTQSGNSEIVGQWVLMSVRNHYEPAYGRLEQFLTTVGRRKFLKPLYEELAKTPEGKERALKIYAKARSGYHPIAQATVDELLGAGGK
jgi:leukotriene A-4 hydrolase/aminopeptidase